jgi:ABC-type amino acid transport substrate-binding protein
MRNVLIAAAVGGLLVFILLKSLGGASSPQTSSHPAFDRVTSTRTLRCAYAAYDPFLVVGTGGKITGLFHDVLEEAAHRLNLKVIWAEEVGYGNINTGFMTGRYDAFCAGLWPAGSRAASTLFSRAVVWDPVSVWVRGNDARFDGFDGIAALNAPDYKIADIDGDATASMVDAFFPKATRAYMTQSQNLAEEFLQVTTNKADALFSDYLGADRFMQGAPGSLRDLSPGKPPLVYALTVGYNQNETALRDMLDVVLDDMNRDGTIARMVKNNLGAKSNLLYREQRAFEPY